MILMWFWKFSLESIITPKYLEVSVIVIQELLIMILVELNRYIDQLIYIGWYLGQVDVSYRLSTTDKISA